MNGFFIVPVAQPRWFELAPSHPPLHKRIAELAELARGMGNVA
jgi:Zn-dependent protease with chaperone function